MSSTINASTASGGGLVTSADASGILQLQTAGVTALTIDGSQNVTLAKGLTVGASAAPAFSAYQSTPQTGIANVTQTKVQFQTEEFDTNSNYDTTNYRFTPTVAGYYQVNALATATTAVNNTNLYISIYKNGVQFKDGCTGSSNAGSFARGSVTSIIFLNGSTDYVEIYVYGNFGAAFNLYNVINGTYFQAAMVRSA